MNSALIISPTSATIPPIGKACDSGDKNEQFSPEARHQGHADTCQGGDDEKGGGNRHGFGQSSQFGNNLRVRAVIDIADRGKEKGRHDAVGKHLENRAVYAVNRHGGKPQSDHSHVRYAGIADYIFQIGLGKADQRPVDDPDTGQKGHKV